VIPHLIKIPILGKNLRVLRLKTDLGTNVEANLGTNLDAEVVLALEQLGELSPEPQLGAQTEAPGQLLQRWTVSKPAKKAP